MNPQEKLQKKISDKRVELDRAEMRVEALANELRMLEQLDREMFGERKNTGGRPPDALLKAEQEKMFAALEEATAEGMAVREIAEKMYDGKFDETIRTRIHQRLERAIEKGTVYRPSQGRYAIKRGPVSVPSES